MSVLVPVLRKLLRWDSARIRRLFASYGLTLLEWTKCAPTGSPPGFHRARVGCRASQLDAHDRSRKVFSCGRSIAAPYFSPPSLCAVHAAPSLLVSLFSGAFVSKKSILSCSRYVEDYEVRSLSGASDGRPHCPRRLSRQKIRRPCAHRVHDFEGDQP